MADFGTSLNSMTRERSSEAAQAFKLLEPSGISLLDAVRSHLTIWIQQGMRDSFCSNHLAAHGDVNKLRLTERPRFKST